MPEPHEILVPAPPSGAPHLAQVLAAAAVASGQVLTEPREGEEALPTTEQAREAAEHLGLSAQVRGGVVVVMVDGLGLHQLRERKGHAATLRRWLGEQADPTAYTCLPSTTAAALTTFGTGALPGATGMVGYTVRHPHLAPGQPPTQGEAAAPSQASASKIKAAGGRPPRLPAVSEKDNLCLISWENSTLQPRDWQRLPTIFERLTPDPERTRSTRGQSAPAAVSVGPSRFAGSGLTLAALRGAKHVGVDRMEERARAAAAALRRGTGLVYLYVGELDHAGHVGGWRSGAWLAELERLDACLRELERVVPRGTRIVLTADHGMIDTGPGYRLVLPALPGLAEDVVGVAGEPRMSHLYLRDPALAPEVAQRYREVLGERAAWVGTREEAAALIGPLSPQAQLVVGDVVVAMAGRWVLVDPRVHSEAAQNLPGVHGSLTAAEREIPLLLTQVD